MLYPASAIQSISILTSLGKRAAWIVERAGDRLDEISTIDLIHPCEISHIAEENCRFQNPVKAAAGCFQHRFDVFKHALGLHGDVALYDLVCRRIERNLPGEISDSVMNNCLRVRSDRLRRILGCDYFFHLPGKRSVPTSSRTFAIFSSFRNSSSSRGDPRGGAADPRNSRCQPARPTPLPPETPRHPRLWPPRRVR